MVAFAVAASVVAVAVVASHSDKDHSDDTWLQVGAGCTVVVAAYGVPFVPHPVVAPSVRHPAVAPSVTPLVAAPFVTPPVVEKGHTCQHAWGVVDTPWGAEKPCQGSSCFVCCN